MTPLLAPAALAVFSGYVVFGVTGFGASPITIPILAHLFPLTFVLPLATILDLTSAVALGAHTRRQASLWELAVLVPFTLAGLVLGVTLLINLPRRVALLTLGAFVCIYAVVVLRRRDPARRLGRGWAAPAGLAGGVLGALFGIGGAPYVAYIAGRVEDAAAQRATIAQMVVVSVGLRAAVFGVAGLLSTSGLWVAAAVLLPVAWIGVWTGNRLHRRLDPRTARVVIAVALLAGGLSIVLRAR